jgi:hypothetical protein
MRSLGDSTSIRQFPAQQVSRRRELMQLLLAHIEDVHHAPPEHDERIRYQATMTPPPEYLGAHDRRPPAVRQHEKLK